MNDERMAQMERRMESMECRVRHYRLALLAVVLALVCMALVGATGDKNAVFDTVAERQVAVVNTAGPWWLL